MGNKLVTLLRRVYHSSPWPIIWVYSKIYLFWSRIRSFRLPVHLYTGVTPGNGHKFTFAYFGWNPLFLSYWLEKFMDRQEKMPFKKHVHVRRIKAFLEANSIDADMALMELSKKLPEVKTEKHSSFVLPRWLKMYLDVDLTLSKIKKRRDIPKRIRRHGLEVETSTTPEDYKFFYEQMHKPYIQDRHQGSAFVEDFKEMFHHSKSKGSILYFAKHDGKRVAGLYELKEEKGPHMYAVGILDGSEEIMRMGVLGAIYFYALQEHKANGIKRVSFGGTSPHLNDGLTMFKLFLGAQIYGIEHQDSPRLSLIPLKKSPAVKDILVSNPFAFIENNAVLCAMFTDSADKEPDEEFQKMYFRSLRINAKSSRIYCFDENNGFSECNPEF